MFKSSSLYLTIPKPCQEGWDDMTPDGTGRFCSSCCKTVIDFTHFTDEEVLAVIQGSPGKICGRFEASQLDRNLYPQKRHQNRLLPAVMISSALVACAGSSAAAQPENTLGLPEAVQLPADLTSTPEKKATGMDTVWIIYGKVVDKSRQGLPAAIVRIKGTNQGTQADDHGSFRLRIPDDLMGQNITLLFNCTGYESQEFRLSDITDPQKFEIVLKETNLQLAGEVVVVKRANLWQRIKRVFR